MIDFAGRPDLLAVAANLIVFPFAVVYRSIRVGVLALSVFHALLVVSLIFGSTLEVLYTKSMLEIILPCTFIPGAIYRSVNTKAV